MARTILVVDDDPVSRRLLEVAITRCGHTVVTASGGGPALDLLLSPRGKTISLMLLDLVMPDIDGIKVLTKLRAVNQELAVIVYTAKGDSGSAAEAMRAGANDVVVKPFSMERIMASIQKELKQDVRSDKVTDPKEELSDPLVALQ